MTLCVKHILIQANNIRLSKRKVKILQNLSEIEAKSTRLAKLIKTPADQDARN